MRTLRALIVLLVALVLLTTPFCASAVQLDKWLQQRGLGTHAASLDDFATEDLMFMTREDCVALLGKRAGVKLYKAISADKRKQQRRRKGSRDDDDDDAEVDMDDDDDDDDDDDAYDVDDDDEYEDEYDNDEYDDDDDEYDDVPRRRSRGRRGDKRARAPSRKKQQRRGRSRSPPPRRAARRRASSKQRRPSRGAGRATGRNNKRNNKKNNNKRQGGSGGKGSSADAAKSAPKKTKAKAAAAHQQYERTVNVTPREYMSAISARRAIDEAGPKRVPITKRSKRLAAAFEKHLESGAAADSDAATGKKTKLADKLRGEMSCK
jgi:hypothetical protein